MRSRLLMAVLALAMIAPISSARAEQQEPAQPAAQPAADEPSKQEPATATPSERKWGDGKAVRDPRKQPAKGDPYNWRQMGFAVILMVAMLAFLIWLVRRQTRDR